MPKQRHGGRNQRSQGGKAGGGSNRQGKLSYDAGDEPAFIRQFKERTGYKAPATAEDKHRSGPQEYDERPRDGDYRLDEERPQIVQLDPTDLSKEEVDVEIAKAKAVEEERKCVDSTGRLLFRKPKEKTDGDEGTTSASSSLKSDIVDMASTSTKAATSNKRKQTTTSSSTSSSSSSTNNEAKKTKSQLLSFMDESGIDGDD